MTSNADSSQPDQPPQHQSSNDPRSGLAVVAWLAWPETWLFLILGLLAVGTTSFVMHFYAHFAGKSVIMDLLNQVLGANGSAGAILGLAIVLLLIVARLQVRRHEQTRHLIQAGVFVMAFLLLLGLIALSSFFGGLI